MEFRILFFLLFLFLSSWRLAAAEEDHQLQTYIVHLHSHELGGSVYPSKFHWHLSFLERTVLSEEDDASTRLLYSYNTALEGFAARLTTTEVEILRSLPAVASVRLDRRLELHTTYSYRFLGLDGSSGDAWHKSGFGRGTVIGVLDTGVWPESPSFNDRGMPPPPRRWKGVCQAGQYFNSTNCNNKLIGARFYSKGHHSSPWTPPPSSISEYISPRDAHGHGTHTSSTAAGSAVPGASVLGMAPGEARGMATGAHVAIYKVCWFNGCYSSDILAAMDDAIRDGVDVLSLSLGGFPVPLFEDSIAIGSFRAAAHGIAVVCAAGNNGPVASSVANEAPWLTTVGASTLDRRFTAVLRLGDGQLLYGESMYPGNHFSKRGGKMELVYEYGENRGSEFCYRGSLNKTVVAGKMVICDRGNNGRAEKGEIVREAGGAGMVLANAEINKEEDSVDVHVLPATIVGYKESLQIKKYIKSTSRPVGQLIFGGTRIGRARAPAVALFSSRGPSFTNPSILKPDLIAPGVNIIAAWPGNLGPSGLPEDSRRSTYSVLSGTSMACPHVSGITALIRSSHPTWSPAAIKSAMMTTANVLDHYGKPILDGSGPAGVFAMGAGHINPIRALDPGLIYDIKPEDYVAHLCTLGYTRSEIYTVTHTNTSCHDLLQRNRGFSLNYPSISVIFKHGRTTATATRRLTNVGSPGSVYTLQISQPRGVTIRVSPKVLEFKELGEIKEYRVWIESKKRVVKLSSYGEGHIIWKHEDKYRVRSPISITWAAEEPLK